VHPNVLLPSATALLGLAFAVILVRRFARRHHAYNLVWSLGLLWYALAAGCEALGGASGWSPLLYRVWYATGAVGVAAYLGAGNLFLHRDPPFGSLAVVCVLGASVPALATNRLDIGFLGLGVAMLLTLVLSTRPRWFANAALGLLIVASAAAWHVIFTAPVDQGLLPTSPDQIVSGQAFDASTRALTPPFNIAGALVLILGALSSALHFARTHTQSRRVTSNVLIAVGAFIPSVASGLTRFNFTPAFFIGELLGLLCILAGFLLSA
jgi:hypothetical protein